MDIVCGVVLITFQVCSSSASLSAIFLRTNLCIFNNAFSSVGVNLSLGLAGSCVDIFNDRLCAAGLTACLEGFPAGAVLLTVVVEVVFD